MLAEIEQRTLVDQLGLVEMIHELVCLEDQDSIDSLSAQEERRLAALRQVFAEESSWSQRTFRRVQTRLPATFKRRGRFGRGTVLDISPGGLRLATSLPLEKGDYLLVRIGRWGTDQFALPCRVQRVADASDGYQLGLSLSGTPLRVRYASPAARKTVADAMSHRPYRSSRRWHVQLG
jgi:hypothetical protein